MIFQALTSADLSPRQVFYALTLHVVLRGQGSNGLSLHPSASGPELCLGLLCQKQAGLMVLACLITADTCDVVMLG